MISDNGLPLLTENIFQTPPPPHSFIDIYLSVICRIPSFYQDPLLFGTEEFFKNWREEKKIKLMTTINNRIAKRSGQIINIGDWFVASLIITCEIFGCKWN